MAQLDEAKQEIAAVDAREVDGRPPLRVEDFGSHYAVTVCWSELGGECAQVKSGDMTEAQIAAVAEIWAQFTTAKE